MTTARVTTQQQYPARATARTFLQTWIPQLLTALLVIPAVVQIIVDEVNKHGVVLPDWLGLALAGILTGCALISAVLARIMAIPAVDAWLKTFRISSSPFSSTRPVLNYSTNDRVLLNDGTTVTITAAILDPGAAAASYEFFDEHGNHGVAHESDVVRHVE
jgi:hypothetical protein